MLNRTKLTAYELKLSDDAFGTILNFNFQGHIFYNASVLLWFIYLYYNFDHRSLTEKYIFFNLLITTSSIKRSSPPTYIVLITGCLFLGVLFSKNNSKAGILGDQGQPIGESLSLYCST